MSIPTVCYLNQARRRLGITPSLLRSALREKPSLNPSLSFLRFLSHDLSSIEFLGVKLGETLNVEPEKGMIFHISQPTLGEAKKEKGNDSILLTISIGGQKLVIGHIKAPHTNHDLVFEKKFDVSHNWKNGSVHFCGYKIVLPDEEGNERFGFDSDSDEEEAKQTVTLPNGKPEPIAKVENKEVVAKPVDAKTNVKIVDSNKEEVGDEDYDEDDDFDEDDDDEEEDMLEAGDDSDDDDNENGGSSEEEETLKKVEQSKRRHAGSTSKTIVPGKKNTKLVTPQKTGGDGKKGAHTATPHPSKKAGGKDAPKTPNSAVTCESCSKSFKSDQALQAHSKAKHSAGK